MLRIHGLSLVLAILTVACTPAFTVTRTVDVHYAPTRSAELLSEAPRRPYVIIATFSGKEDRSCPADTPFCSLRQQARTIGAHAVWIRKREVLTYPGDWIMIDGRLTRLRPFTIEHVEGALIRYLDN